MGKLAGLAKEQRRALDRLKAVPGLERFYLAGGSAIAVHLGHRRSLDLDLFSTTGKVDLLVLGERIGAMLPDVAVLGTSTKRPGALRSVHPGLPPHLVILA